MRGSLVVAILALLGFFILGSAVSATDPSAFDLATASWVGVATPLAWIFTASCLLPTLSVYAVLAISTAVTFPAWRGRVIFALAVTLVTWQASDLFKARFARPRPEHWVRVHETSFAYPSGHAMFAVLVYGLWAYFIWKSGLSRGARMAISGLLVLWAFGVIWSRLALGAHYPTDLIGGVLLAAAALGIGNAVAIAIAGRRRVRSA
jgi:undecaprenyl-diphosphatase